MPALAKIYICRCGADMQELYAERLLQCTKCQTILDPLTEETHTRDVPPIDTDSPEFKASLKYYKSPEQRTAERRAELEAEQAHEMYLMRYFIKHGKFPPNSEYA